MAGSPVRGLVGPMCLCLFSRFSTREASLAQDRVGLPLALCSQRLKGGSGALGADTDSPLRSWGRRRGGGGRAGHSFNWRTGGRGRRGPGAEGEGGRDMQIGRAEGSNR